MRLNLLVIAAFTPYLGTALSLRVEHLIIYPLFLLLLRDLSGLERAFKLGARLLVPWFLLMTLVVANVFVRETDRGSLSDFSVTARILALTDSFLLQAIAFLLVVRWISPRPMGSKRHVRTMAATFLGMMCANSLFILFVDPDSVETLLRQFWTNPNPIGPGAYIAANELTAGRYGGIFNQPFDGGLAYAYALLVWRYLAAGYQIRSIRSTLMSTAALLLIMGGGLSTGSKVFLAGMLLLLGQILWARTGNFSQSLPRNLRLLGTAIVGLSAVVWLNLADFSRFWRFFGAIGQDVGELSGGRFRTGREWWNKVLVDASFIGTRDFYTDDAVRAYLTGGGIVGLVLIGLVYRELFRISARLPLRSTERGLGFGLTLMTLGASFGSVSLQTSRASTIYWVLMGALLAHGRGVASGLRYAQLNQAIKPELDRRPRTLPPRPPGDVEQRS